MAAVQALRLNDNNLGNARIVETDQILISGLQRSGSGPGALYDDANVTTITIGGGAAQTSITIGGGAAYTGATIGRTGVDDNFQGNVVIAGNLTVNGTQTIVDTELQTADNCILMNSEYTSDTAQESCLVMNIDPDPSSFTITSIASNVITVGGGDPGAAGYAAGDFMLVQDPANTANAGIYEILSTTATTITIDTTPAETFSGTALVDDATAQGTVVKVQLAVFRSNTSGTFQGATGTTAPLTYTSFASAALGWDDVLANDANSGANNPTITSGQFLDGAAELGLRATGANSINFTTNGNARFNISSDGHFLANTDNTLDIGATGATRPRTAHIGTSVVVAADVTVSTGSIASAGALTVASAGANALSLDAGNNTIESNATAANFDAAIAIAAGAGANAVSLTGGAGSGTAGGASSIVGGAGDGANAGGAAGVTGGAGGATGIGGPVNITSGNGGATSGNSGNITIDVGTITSGTTGTVSVGTSQASAVNIGNATSATTVGITAGSAADLTFTARGGSITINESGNTTLSGFTATSVIGALNELKTSAGQATFTNNSGGTLTAGTVVHATTTADEIDEADATADNIASRGFGVVVSDILDTAAGSVALPGQVIEANFLNGLTLNNGDPVYLSTTAGDLTNDVSGFAAGNVVQHMGYVTDNANYAGNDKADIILFVGPRTEL